MTDSSDTSDAATCVQTIAERFGESKPRALAHLADLAKVFGPAWMLQVADQAEREIAAAGPATLRGNGKPRTRGGVFFAVAKVATYVAFEQRAVSRKAVRRLFKYVPKELIEKVRAQQNQPPAAPSSA